MTDDVKTPVAKALDTLSRAADGDANRQEVADAVNTIIRGRDVFPYWCNVAPEAKAAEDPGRFGTFPGYTEHRVYVRRGANEGMVLEVRSETEGRDFPQVRAKILDTARQTHRKLYEVAEQVAAILNGFQR